MSTATLPDPRRELKKQFKRLVLGLIATAVGMLALHAAPALAQSMTLDLGDGGNSGSFTGRIVQLTLLVTVLSLAPSLLIMVTSFTRIIVVLSLLRSAIGTQQSPPNMVMVSLALFLTFFVMAPVFQQAWQNGIQPLVNGQIEETEAMTKTVAPFRTFMLAHVREGDLRLFADLGAQTGADKVDPIPEAAPTAPTAPTAPVAGQPAAATTPAGPPLTILIPAFMISELHRAFEIGFLLFLPFLIIDMVVASVLMSMGMMMLPPTVISLPFKIIFFVLVDGWYLVAGSLVRSYTGAG